MHLSPNPLKTTEKPKQPFLSSGCTWYIEALSTDLLILDAEFFSSVLGATVCLVGEGVDILEAFCFDGGVDFFDGGVDFLEDMVSEQIKIKSRGDWLNA